MCSKYSCNLRKQFILNFVILLFNGYVDRERNFVQWVTISQAMEFAQSGCDESSLMNWFLPERTVSLFPPTASVVSQEAHSLCRITGLFQIKWIWCNLVKRTYTWQSKLDLNLSFTITCFVCDLSWILFLISLDSCCCC